MEKIIVGNWKMNGSLDFIGSFFSSFEETLKKCPNQIILCPPFPYISSVLISIKGSNARLGAQNCHPSPQGAYTGEVSASMLADIGCQVVIVGHSERRSLFGETNATVKEKAASIHSAGMTAIVCIGESLKIRESGNAIETVTHQLRESLPLSSTPQNTLIAYEPIWAIGTGLTAEPKDIVDMHNALYSATNEPFPLLYGGSVTDQNAKSILSLPHVDGVLVGGASLKVDAFRTISQFNTQL